MDELLEAVVGGVFADRGDEEAMTPQAGNSNNEHGTRAGHEAKHAAVST